MSAAAHHIHLTDNDEDWYRPHESATRPLTEFRATLMRKDPPFDLEYVASTWLLSAAEREGAKVFNSPNALREHNEKFAIAEFPKFTVPSLVSRRMEDLQAFIEEHKTTVLKRLDGMGGTGIFVVRHDDPNRNSIVETISVLGTRSVMAQRYIPEIKEGDKRVLLIDGKLVPHCLARIPKAGESRGNLAAGARGVAQPITKRHREIGGSAGPGACQARTAPGGAGRDRRLAHRSQRDQPDLLPRDPGPDRVRCLGNVSGVSENSKHDRRPPRHPRQHRRGAVYQRFADPRALRRSRWRR